MRFLTSRQYQRDKSHNLLLTSSQTPSDLGGRLRGGHRPPILQYSAGRRKVRQKGGGFQGVGVGAGSTGWQDYGARAVQASQNSVTKIAEKSFSIIIVVSE